MTRIAFLCFALMASWNCIAQDWLGYHTSNYAGIHGVQYNPATLAGSNYKFDVSLVAGSFNVSNNFLFGDAATLTNFNLFSEPNFFDRYFYPNYDGNFKKATIQLNLQAPAFFFKINRKNSIGFAPRIRTMVNADHVDEPLARLIMEDLNYPPFWNTYFNNDYMSVNVHAWAEYGISYARIISEKDGHIIKGGITAKLLQGLAAGYFTARNYNYNFVNQDTLSLQNFNAYYGLSPNLESGQIGFDFNNLGYGIDIGFTYEFEPGRYNRRGMVNKRRYKRNFGLWAEDQTKYKYKLGASINDIGGIRYRKSPNSGNFFANRDSISLALFENANGLNEYNQLIQNLFTPLPDDSVFFMDLPLHLTAFFDYRFKKGYAIHAGFNATLNSGKGDDHRSHNYFQLTVTPRWESKWFGVYMPLSFNEHMLFNIGLSLRAGPLVIGTGDLLGNLIKREYASTDIHFALRLIFPSKHTNSSRPKCPAYGR